MSAFVPAMRAKPRPLRFPVERWLLYLLILAFPFFSVQPKLFRPDWWVSGLLILAFGFSVLLKGRLRLDPIGRAALGLHAAVLLSVVVNFWGWEGPQWTEFTTLWLQLLFATLLYLAMANLKLSREQLRSLLRFWILVASIVALYGLYQVLARNLGWPLAYLPYLHPHPERLPSGLSFAGYVRPSSFLREPTFLGMYLLAPLAVVAVFVFYRQDRIWLFHTQKLNYIVLLILLSALLVSFALAAYITLIVILCISLVLSRSTRKTAVHLIIVLSFVSAILITAFEALEIPFLKGLDARISRISSALSGTGIRSAGPSIPTRYEEIILAFSTWFHHPILGIGLNQLEFIGPRYVPEDLRSRVVERGYTHNMWLGALVQLGIVGFFFFSLIWFQGLRMMWEAFRHCEGALRWVSLAFFYVLLAAMIRGFMGGPLTFLLYWFYLGLSSVVYRTVRSETL